MKLSGEAKCCWEATAPRTSYSKARGSIRTEVAVVGAGIVGLTAAYHLAKAGLSVVVLESRRIGRQVTGRSTAKITTQHSLIYRHLITTFNLDQAKHYADANRDAAYQIREWVQDLAIACDFEVKDAYAYTCDARMLADIEAEAEAARSVGFIADVLSKAPLPFETSGALRFPDQAQFNPIKYLIGLAGAARAAGARICENTRVMSVDAGKRWRIKVDHGRLDAEHVILATHLPIAGQKPYDALTLPRCHTAMAFRMEAADAIDGMFIGIDEPTRSLRMGRDRKGPLLVALGPRFNTGQDGDVAGRFHELESWVRRNLPVGDVVWRWVNEDYETADRLPFVGSPTKETRGLYIATGFNGWGITNGTAAGTLIADLIRGRPNSSATVYDAARKAPKKFNKGGDTQSRVQSLGDIRPGHGGVLKHGKGDIAVWKSADGTPHAFSAFCTHKGCTVTWNNADRTWDCPCHGSIFSANGDVIHGPAVEPLPSRKLPSNWTRRRSRRSRSSSSKAR